MISEMPDFKGQVDEPTGAKKVKKDEISAGNVHGGEAREIKGKEVEFGVALPSDSREIYEVKKASWLATYSAPEYGLSKEDIEQKDFFNKVEKLENRLASGEAQSFVVKSEGKIVGYCTGVKGSEFNKLHAFHILPEFQGRGIGTQLIEKVIAWLGDEKPIVVDVAEPNQRAIHIYEKFGFVCNQNSDKLIMESFPSGKRLANYQMIRHAKEKRS